MRLVVADGKRKTRLPSILRAALRLFVAKGIDATTTKEIAARARVAEGALYRHFKSKEDMAFYLFSANLNRFSADLMAKVAAVAGVREKVGVFVAECLAAFERDRDLLQFLILAEHREFKRYSKSYTHVGDVLERILAEGQAQGALRPGDKYNAVAVLFGSLTRLMVIRARGLIREPLTERSKELTEMLWSAIKR